MPNFDFLRLGILSTLVILLLSGLAFFVHYNTTGYPELKDSQEYLNLADNLSHKNSHYAGDLESPVDYRLYSKRPLLYPSFILFSSAQFLQLLRIIQWVFIPLLFLIGLSILQLLKAERSSFIIYAVLFVVSVGLIISSSFVMADLLLSVLIAIISYYGVRFELFKRKTDFYLVVAIWSVTLMLKPVMLLSLIAIPVLAFRYKKHLNASTIGLISPLLAAALVFGINMQTTGHFHYSSISSINLSFYNAKLLIANEYGFDSAQKYTEDSIFETPRSSNDFKNYISSLNSRAKNTIMDKPVAYAKIHLMGMFKSLLDPGRFELSHLFKSASSGPSLTEYIMARNWEALFKELKTSPGFISLFIALLLFSILKFVGFANSIFSRDSKRWILVLICLYFVFMAGPIGAFRFALPAFVPYIVLGTLGLERLFLFFKKSSKSQNLLPK